MLAPIEESGTGVKEILNKGTDDVLKISIAHR